MTQTLTTERLKDLTFHRSKLIFPASHEEAAAMARELLANREAQPVYQMRLLDGSPEQNTWDEVTHEEFNLPLKNPDEWSKRVLYTAPSAPAVPDEYVIFESAIDECRKSDEIDEHAWNHGVMVVVAKFNTCRAAMLAQPVSQRYKLVPVELTPEMQAAWDGAPNNSDDDTVNMMNAYRAMLAAVPEYQN